MLVTPFFPNPKIACSFKNTSQKNVFGSFWSHSMGLSGRKPGHMYVASYMLLINPVRAPRRPFLSKFKINRKNILFSRNISMLFSKIKKKKTRNS